MVGAGGGMEERARRGRSSREALCDVLGPGDCAEVTDALEEVREGANGCGREWRGMCRRLLSPDSRRGSQAGSSERPSLDAMAAPEGHRVARLVWGWWYRRGGQQFLKCCTCSDVSAEPLGPEVA